MTGWFPVPLHSFLHARMDLLKQSSAFPSFYTSLCLFLATWLISSLLLYKVLHRSQAYHDSDSVLQMTFHRPAPLTQTLASCPHKVACFTLCYWVWKDYYLTALSVRYWFIFLWCLLCFAGLGMYDSSVFLGAHEEESGGRSVPTTPLQIAAPGMYKITHPFLVSSNICSIVTLILFHWQPLFNCNYCSKLGFQCFCLCVFSYIIHRMRI